MRAAVVRGRESDPLWRPWLFSTVMTCNAKERDKGWRKLPPSPQLTLTFVVPSREYYPQNIMFDKRVHRGNSYAAMVIPAGTTHDTMIMEKRQTQKA